MKKSGITGEARRVLTLEAAAVMNARKNLGADFECAVDMIMKCKGKVVVSGIGKSGIIGQKISATMSSTGTPSVFLHSTEAAHGDMGIVSRDDVAIVISHSGETGEVTGILPALKRLGIPLIAITGKKTSTLAKNASCVLDASVTKEACPMNLAPTASTTVQLAIGDALAVVLLKLKGFKKEDFAMFHPGGSLGKKLILKVKDMMHTGAEVPVVSGDATLQKGLLEMTKKRFGCTAVVNPHGAMTGIFTDGDLRRLLETDGNPYGMKMKQVMTKKPRTIKSEDLAIHALNVMQRHSITVLIVQDRDGKPEGIIHMHDILKSGVV
ncbi:MAG: KpsF/GutQ family sugar-phosphate isomerase [Spirochaetia bacterium]|nr:KpsF/GutQ family sugar-phosphate isomerase [Spirochaetia bacterium]